MLKKYKAIFSRNALEDLKEAKNWYTMQQKNLSKRFVADVRNVVESIKRNPYFASVKYQNIRTAACKIFPYALHYEIDEENNIARIISIFHFSREPYWL